MVKASEAGKIAENAMVEKAQSEYRNTIEWLDTIVSEAIKKRALQGFRTCNVSPLYSKGKNINPQVMREQLNKYGYNMKGSIICW